MKVTVTLPDEEFDPSCPVRSILDRVGDKWTVLVISHLAAQGPLRFTELKRRATGISQRMLTETVRGLERDGVLSRTVYPTIPPKVEYELTTLGSTLVAPIQTLVAWSLEHRMEIAETRKRYDRIESQPIEPVPNRHESRGEKRT